MTSSVLFHVALPTHVYERESFDPDSLRQFVTSAEKLGFCGLWVVDHLARPYGSSLVGKKATWLEPLTALSYVASLTRRPRLGTAVLVLPLRNPVITAKTIAALDVLSGGRVTLGISAGYSPKEFEACGVPLQQRGEILDEYAEVVGRLLAEPLVSYSGKFVQFSDLSIEPRPIQRPRPPIWFGGGVQHPLRKAYSDKALEKALRRIAKLGEGHITPSWLIPHNDTRFLQKSWEQLARYAMEFGRDPSEISRAHFEWFLIAREKDEAIRHGKAEVARSSVLPFEELRKYWLIGTPGEIAECLRARVKAGIQHLIMGPLAGQIDQIEMLANEVVPAVVK